ncbi:hypothetical protein CYCME_1127 [Cycloclasticus zancles 78-ME]|uniref:Uncharacterized protein n=2 Tax=Cycloclasticus zancles TaxID=1329899 RepID=S5TWU0_9GAMM|nr:hypothetical protein CYCME_1127 [Cycloclasticus zancles 78-ME]
MVRDNRYDVDIGYMFISVSQIEATEKLITRERGNDTLITDTSRRLFKEFGLPDVNSIVELNVNSSMVGDFNNLLSEDGLNEIAKSPYIDKVSFTEQGKRIVNRSLQTYRLNFNLLLSKGTTVKILGYRMIYAPTKRKETPYIEKSLAALVKIIKC